MNKKLQAWLEGLEAAPPTPLEPPAPEVELPAEPVAPAPGEPAPPPEVAVLEPSAPEGDEERPTEELELLNFEDFRQDFIDFSVNAKPDDLLDRLDELRGIVDLGPKEKKFLTDNIQILLLMKEEDVYSASRKLHRIEDPMEMASELSEVLDKSTILREVMIKLPSFFGMKADLHRKFVAALIGGIQIGGGGRVEDVVVSPTKGQRILISTRFFTSFGHISLLPWSLSKDDPDIFLKDIERERLERGSPEERRVLLKRVLLSSIAKLLGGRIFLISGVHRASGKRTDIALQMDRFLNEGYEKGLLKIGIDEDEERMIILPDGTATTPGQIVIFYVDPEDPGKEPQPFFELREGVFYLVGDSTLVEEGLNKIGNGLFKTSEFEGTEEELDTVQQCVPTLQEMLMKRC